MVAEYCRLGWLEPHVERLRVAYGRKRDAMLAALRQHMPAGVTWTEPAGGMFVWVRLPASVKSDDMVGLALDAGVSFVPGSAFDTGQDSASCLRLNFTSSSVEEIARGVRVLAEVVRDFLDEPTAA